MKAFDKIRILFNTPIHCFNKPFFFVLFITGIGFGVYLGLNHQPVEMGIAVAGSTLLYLLGNAEMFHKLSIGPNGVEIERIAEKAKDEIREIQHDTAILLSTLAMDLYQGARRLGGYPPERKEFAKEQIQSVLKSVNVPSDTIEDLFEKNWHSYIIFDYSRYALNGNRHPSEFVENQQTRSPGDQEALTEWNNLRKGRSIKHPLSPEEIESFWKRHNCLTPARQSIIDDYKYYLQHKRHKRPDLFHNEYMGVLES